MLQPCSACDGWGFIRFMGKLRRCWLCDGTGHYDDSPKEKPVEDENSASEE